MTIKECIRCKKIVIEDFEKWKSDNLKGVFAYCKYCRIKLPVMRDIGVDI